MKSRPYARLATGVALVYFTLTAVCQNIPSEVPFRLLRETLIVVQVQANGQGPFDFLLDTGNDVTILDPALADRLGLIRSGHLLQTSIAGRRAAEKGLLGSLVLGTARTSDLAVIIQDLGVLRQVDPHIQGVLSQDFLSRFSYLLDYSRRTLRIELETELRYSLEGRQIPLEPRRDVVHEKMIVVANARALSHSTLRLVLDSGANALVLMSDASKRLQVPENKLGWEQTLAGNVAVHNGLIRQITLGTVELHDVMAAISTESATPFGDGLLPTSLFQSLYVNNRENFVVFNPKIKDSSRHRKDHNKGNSYFDPSVGKSLIEP